MRNKFEGSKDVGEDKLIKIESVLNEGQLKTESARIQSAKTFDLQKPKSKIVVNQLNNEDDHMQFHGKTNNPRELQQKLDQKNFFEIFERGSNLYAKVHHQHDLGKLLRLLIISTYSNFVYYRAKSIKNQSYHHKN